MSPNYLTIFFENRSRRGSRENILEKESQENSVEEFVNTGGCEDNKEEESNMNGNQDGEEIVYFLQVSVSTSFLEKKVLNHPGVSEVIVRGVEVEGVGKVPRAYVTLKTGFSVPADELVTWVNSRLEWRYRWK